MLRTMLKSKIHRVAVTEASPEYEGSLIIDADLLDAVGIVSHEQVHVWDVTNGARLIAYVLPGERASGVVQVHGSAASVIKQGDHLEIAAFTLLKPKAAKKHLPKVLILDELNKPLVAGAPSEVPPTPPMGAAPRRRRTKKVTI